MEGFDTTLREQLKNSIRTSSMLVDDSRTYLWIRYNPEWLLGDRNGGGNWMMIIGLLSVINFLAKINRLLTKGPNLLTEYDAAIEHFNSLQKNDPLLEKLGRPHPKSLLEKDCFIRLVRDIYPKVDLGLSGETDEEVGKVWERFRNCPSHMATLRKGDGAYVFLRDNDQESFEEISQAIFQNDREVIAKYAKPQPPLSFFQEDSKWMVNSDILACDTMLIFDYIFQKIDDPTTAIENVEGASDYIRKEVY